MTNTEAAKAILADKRATPRERRFALALMEQAFEARFSTYDQVQRVKQQLMIGRAA